MEVECERCGEMCEVEEVKGCVYMAWCLECNDYATEKNYFPEIQADYADMLRKQERECG